MSFSREVKEEIVNHISNARHCRIAELAAIITMCGMICMDSKHQFILEISTENGLVAEKCDALIKKLFQITTKIGIRKHEKSRQGIYAVRVYDTDEIHKLLQAVKMDIPLTQESELPAPDQIIFRNSCCKRAYIRGAFFAAGSLSDPEKTYHFEVVISDPLKATQLKEIINSFFIDAKIVIRKKNYVVYIKEGSQIVDLLNIMEAHVSLMKLENVRILKEMRNSINRQVNCEAANINKTVLAASKQVDDIEFIRDTIGFGELSESLADVARLRLLYPEASLKELGTMLMPPIGKSGVNHRLAKLCDIAEGLRP